MIVKRVLLGVLFFLLTVSCIQLFNVPPYAGDVNQLYRSGYFDELDRGFDIIRDSFLSLKTMTRVEYGWIFLADMEDKHNMKIGLFDLKGFELAAPGIRTGSPDPEVTEAAITGRASKITSTTGGRYSSIVPVRYEPSCLICHNKGKEGDVAGYLRFERDSDSLIYYSSERVILFTLFSIIIAVFIFFAARWEPASGVKDLFDK